jgi:hypothetical protein
MALLSLCIPVDRECLELSLEGAICATKGHDAVASRHSGKQYFEKKVRTIRQKCDNR